MRCVSVLVLTVTFCLGLADWGIAGPFGLSMGLQPAELGGKLGTLTSPGEYVTAEVPNPHSSFSRHSLLFGPKTGLCMILAFTNVLATSADGTELRMDFDNLEERLKAQYGKSKREDFLQAGSRWKEPQYFMKGLLKKERVLKTAWNSETGAALRDHLLAIWVAGEAISSERGFIGVVYVFENFEECQKELNAEEDDAL